MKFFHLAFVIATAIGIGSVAAPANAGPFGDFASSKDQRIPPRSQARGVDYGWVNTMNKEYKLCMVYGSNNPKFKNYSERERNCKARYRMYK